MPELRPRVSYAELVRFPDDGRRFELHGGQLLEMPAPSFRHQRAVVRIVAAFSALEESAHGVVVVSPFDLVIGEYDVLQPDVMFFTAAQARRIEPDGVARIAPEVAIEVLSAGTAAKDRGRKMLMLARFGVREYWLVDAGHATVEQYVLEDGAFVLQAVASGPEHLASIAVPALTISPAVIGAE